MGASSNRPSFSILRAPQANTLAAATSHQVATKELAQLGVVNNNWIRNAFTVGAVVRRVDFRKGRSAVVRVGSSQVVSAVERPVSVIVDHNGLAFIRGADRDHAFAPTQVPGGVTT